MLCKKVVVFSLGIGSLTGLSDAFWRISCSIIQTGRIDPVVSPGKISSYTYKISGASNIGLNSTYDDLQSANCTSCEIQADKSAYWTPLLYYQHSNGSFEEVPNNGMTVYYLGRGDNAANIKPFPPGFRMVSGDTGARSYNTTASTYLDKRPIADRVSFACLDSSPMPETPGMNNINCKNGMRAQIHFQSCWDGVNLYKTDNSHVAYMSTIDSGVCPPSHPVQLIHLFFEVLYSTDKIVRDRGHFVFANGDPTGFGFHGDFLNGWNPVVQESAIDACATGNANGVIQECAPLAVSNITDYATVCPTQPPIVEEPATGMIAKLPGCITITPGPEEATAADMTCPPESPLPPLNPEAGIFVAAPVVVNNVGSYVTGGCYAEGTTGRALNDTSYTDILGMTVETCVAYCQGKGLGYAGLEFSQECWCGTEIVNGGAKYNTTGGGGCDMACSGNPLELCGGVNALLVYESG